MNIKDEALIIYVKKINENNLYLKLLTKNNGMKPAIVYGGNSKKNRNNYQIGNFIYFNLSQKNENQISNINAELKAPLISNIFNDQYKLYAALNTCALINLFFNENLKYKDMYMNTKNIFLYFQNNHWFYNYIKWLLNLLTEVGFGFDWDQLNLQKEFLDLNNLQFINRSEITNFNTNQYVIFPYRLIINQDISYRDCNLFFDIFEKILKNHALNHTSKKIPKIYFDFRRIILNRLK